MSHEIELCGCLTIPDNANFDEITDVFLDFVESHGWYYGGGFSEIRKLSTKRNELGQYESGFQS